MLYEIEISNNGQAIILDWLEHGWLCPECIHKIYLLANNADFLIPKTILKPYSLRTHPVVAAHEIIPCKDHAFVLEWKALVDAYQTLIVEAENFKGDFRVAPPGQHAVLPTEQRYWEQTVRFSPRSNNFVQSTYKRSIRQLTKYLEHGYCRYPECGKTIPFVSGKRRREPYCSKHLPEIKAAKEQQRRREQSAIRRYGVLFDARKK